MVAFDLPSDMVTHLDSRRGKHTQRKDRGQRTAWRENSGAAAVHRMVIPFL